MPTSAEVFAPDEQEKNTYSSSEVFGDEPSPQTTYRTADVLGGEAAPSGLPKKKGVAGALSDLGKGALWDLKQAGAIGEAAAHVALGAVMFPAAAIETLGYQLLGGKSPQEAREIVGRAQEKLTGGGNRIFPETSSYEQVLNSPFSILGKGKDWFLQTFLPQDPKMKASYSNFIDFSLAAAPLLKVFVQALRSPVPPKNIDTLRDSVIDQASEKMPPDQVATLKNVMEAAEEKAKGEAAPTETPAPAAATVSMQEAAPAPFESEWAEKRKPETAALRARLDELIAKSKVSGVTPEEVQELADSAWGSRQGMLSEGEARRMDALTKAKSPLAWQEEVGPDKQQIAIDANGFKALNDRFGHDAGDIALQKIVAQARSLGLNIYRKGGDEFVLSGEPKQVGTGVVKLQKLLDDENLSIAYGFGKDFASADQAMYAMKTKIKKSETLVSSHAAEGSWSPEAVSRQKNYTYSVYDTRTGQTRPLPGVDAVDYQPRPTEIKIQTNKLTGKVELAGQGEMVSNIGTPGVITPLTTQTGVQPVGHEALPHEALTPEQLVQPVGGDVPGQVSLPTKVGGLRLDKLLLDTEGQRAAADIAAKVAQRKPKMTQHWADVRAQAAAALKEGKVTAEDLQKAPGETLPVETAALQQASAQSFQDVATARAQYQADPSPENLATLKVAIAKSFDLHVATSERTTGLARALSLQKDPYGAVSFLANKGEAFRASLQEIADAKKAYQENATPENLAALNKAIEDSRAISPKRHGTVAYGSPEFLVILDQRLKDYYAKMGIKGQEFAERTISLDRTDPYAVQRAIKKVASNPRRYGKWVEQLWLNGLLSNVTKTGGVKIASDIFQTIAAPLQRAAGLDFSGAGHQVQGMASGMSAMAQGLSAGLLEGVRKAAFIIKNNVDAPVLKRVWEGAKAGREATARGMFNTLAPYSKSEFQIPSAIPGAVGDLVNFPTSNLKNITAAFHAIHYTGDIWRRAYGAASQALRDGRITEGEVSDYVRSLITDPTEEMMKGATQEALNRTFQAELGKVGKAFVAARNSIGPAGKVIAPFYKTPTNIVKQGLELTPLGAPVLAAKMFKHGYDPVMMGKIVTGTALSIAAFELAKNGGITGAGPKDPKERATWLATGKIPFGFRTPSGYISFARAEPFAIPIGLAASAHEIWDMATEKEQDKLASQISYAFNKSVLDRTFWETLSEVIESAAEPLQAGKRFAARLAESAVPAGVAAIAQSTDPIIRDAQSLIDGIKARIPGVSKTLYPRRDIFGNEVTRGGGPAMPFLPTQVSPNKNDAVADEMNRLNMNIGYAPKKLNQVDLTGAQKDELAQLLGQYRYKFASAIINSPGYRDAGGDHMKKLLLMGPAMNQAAQIATRIFQSRNSLPPAKLLSLINALKADGYYTEGKQDEDQNNP